VAEEGIREGNREICCHTGEEVAKVERSHVREVKLMPIKVERILFRIGEGSLAVTLPKAWVVYNRLQPGDTVEVIVNDGVTVHIKKKPGTEDAAES